MPRSSFGANKEGAMKSITIVPILLAFLVVASCDDDGNTCTPNCVGRTCGPDGCGGICGTCPAGETCTASGVCEGCTPNCAGRVCGSDGCGGSCGTCPTGEVCTTSGTCEAAGNLPCTGCAGYPCSTTSDCTGGLICVRVNSTYAFCSNCNLATYDCGAAGWCSADVNCGEGGVCMDSTCYHGCASAADCPSGYECLGGTICIPSVLPGLDEECAMSASFWCRPSLTEDRYCFYYGTDPVSDPGENFCTRSCTTDSDCQDVWTLGCCVPTSGGISVCTRRTHCGG